MRIAVCAEGSAVSLPPTHRHSLVLPPARLPACRSGRGCRAAARWLGPPCWRSAATRARGQQQGQAWGSCRSLKSFRASRVRWGAAAERARRWMGAFIEVHACMHSCIPQANWYGTHACDSTPLDAPRPLFDAHAPLAVQTRTRAARAAAARAVAPAPAARRALPRRQPWSSSATSPLSRAPLCVTRRRRRRWASPAGRAAPRGARQVAARGAAKRRRPPSKASAEPSKGWPKTWRRRGAASCGHWRAATEGRRRWWRRSPASQTVGEEWARALAPWLLLPACLLTCMHSHVPSMDSGWRPGWRTLIPLPRKPSK